MRRVMVLFSLLACVSHAAAAEFTVNTRGALVGQDRELGIAFASRLHGTDMVVVEFHADGKHIIAHIDYRTHTVQIESRGLDSPAPITLIMQEIDRLQRALTSLYVGGSRVAEALVSTLTWLVDYPPDAAVELQTDMTDVSSQQGSTSICDLIG